MLAIHLLKTKKGLKNLRKQEIQIIFTKMVLIKLVFNEIWFMVNIKILTKRTQSDKVLRGEAFEIASNPKYHGYQRRLASIVYKLFNTKSTGSGVNFMPNQQHENELHKPIVQKFKRRKVY